MALQHQTAIATQDVEIRDGRHKLNGTLAIPAGARGLVVFSHGSGSSRFSPRNRFVAEALQQADLATLLIDLLEEQEEQDRRNVFDIDLLSSRLQGVADWLSREPNTAGLRVGYFGASTGAASALVAAAKQPARIAAVVSRGGRPDLAREYFPRVKAPTLLIVGGDDDVVVQLNEDALSQLTCTKEMVVISGASHLFPEPGALEEVARLATDWFVRHLLKPGKSSG
jgi:putative phosphoribosyl transferase